MVVPGGVDPRQILTELRDGPEGPGPLFSASDTDKLRTAISALSQPNNSYTRQAVAQTPGQIRDLGDPNDPRRGTSRPQINQSAPGAPAGYIPRAGESSAPQPGAEGWITYVGSQKGPTDKGEAWRSRPENTGEPPSRVSGRNILAQLGVSEAPPVHRTKGGQGSMTERPAEPVSVKRGFGSGGMFAQPANRDADAGYREQMLTAEQQRTATEGEKPPFDPSQRKGVVEAMEQRTTGRSRTGTSESTRKRKATDMRARAQRVTPEDVAYLQAVEDQLRADRGEPGRAADIEVIPPELQAILDEYAEQIPRDVPNPTDPLDPRRTRIVEDRNSGQNSGSSRELGETWTDSRQETVPATIQVPIRGNDGQLVKITVDDLRRAGYSDDQIAQSGRVGTYATKTISSDMVNSNEPVLNPESGEYNDITFNSANQAQVTASDAAAEIRQTNRTAIRSQATIEQLRAAGLFTEGHDPERSSYYGEIKGSQREALGLTGEGPIKVYSTKGYSEGGGHLYRLDRDVPYDYDAIREEVNPQPELYDSKGRRIERRPVRAPGDKSAFDGIDGLQTRVVTTGADFYVDEDGVRRQEPGTGTQVEVGPTPFMNRPDAVPGSAIEGKFDRDGNPRTQESILAGIRRNNERSVGSKKVYDGRTRQQIANPLYESSKGITGTPEGVISELAGARGTGDPTNSTATGRRALAQMIRDGELTIDDLGTNTSRPDSVARADLELAIKELDNEMARASGQRADGVDRPVQTPQETQLAQQIASGEIDGATLAAGFRQDRGSEAQAPIEALFRAEQYGTSPGKALWAAGNIDGSGRAVASRYQTNSDSIADTSEADFRESNYNNTDDFDIDGAIQSELRGFTTRDVLTPEEEAGRTLAAQEFGDRSGLSALIARSSEKPEVGREVQAQLADISEQIYDDAALTARGVPTTAQIRESAAKFVPSMTGTGGRYAGGLNPSRWVADYHQKGAIADADAPVQQATTEGVTNTSSISQINAPAPQGTEFAGYDNRYGASLRR